MVTSGDSDEGETKAVMMAMAPVLLVTGYYPPTDSESFKPFAHYAELIRTRNQGEMNKTRAREILVAMDRCFGDKDVKKMSKQKLLALFGPPNDEKVRGGWKILIYQIQGGKFGERWLTLD